jgi:hypothetical protein
MFWMSKRKFASSRTSAERSGVTESGGNVNGHGALDMQGRRLYTDATARETVEHARHTCRRDYFESVHS